MSEPAAAPNNTAQVSDYSLSLVRNGIRSQVLKNIDLQIRSGEILGLVGESGSGKSVLALSLLGLLPDGSHPHADGAVTVGGVDMLRAKPAELRRVRRDLLGAIFQDPMSACWKPSGSATQRCGCGSTRTNSRVGCGNA